MRNELLLSIVVIGKNEKSNLPRLIKSLQNLEKLSKLDIQTIFVDSASDDLSPELAKLFFNEVYVLEKSPNLCAAAGRYIGTLKAKSKFILYLDADMEICKEFIPIILKIVTSGDVNLGYVGWVNHYFDNGKISLNAYGDNNNYMVNKQLFVKHFGGAVILPRLKVLEAGNYNPCVFSNEEIDLNTRLRGLGVRVRFINQPMVNHNDKYFSNISLLVSWIVPTHISGKQYHGFGQLIASRVKSKQLKNLMKYFPYPFIFWLGIIFSIISLLYGQMLLSSAIIFSFTAYIIIAKGKNFPIVYFTFIFQLLLGYCKYNSQYTPIIEKEYHNKCFEKKN